MFIIDCETHIVQPTDDVDYFPYFKMHKQALTGISRGITPKTYYGISSVKSKSMEDLKAEGSIILRPPGAGRNADDLIRSMDDAGVQMACVVTESMLAETYGARMKATNGWLAKQIAKYPDRLVGVCNVGPIIWRGVKNAVWELEYLVKEMNFKAVKLYPPDDTPINNKELWPYYEKIQALGVPIFIHMGLSWIVPGRSAYCTPLLLEDICEDFPELTILAYHMAYPFTDELNMCAGKFPNLYIGTSLLPQFGHGASRRSQKLLGEAIMWAGIDKIIWGSDIGPTKDDVAFLKEFQISKEVQQDYGYPPLSEEDRQKWAGLNLARILKITPKV
jgi:hypothetical protein